MTVACVLTTRNTGRCGGTCYGPEWIWALKRGLAEHMPDATFRYLSDVAPGPWRITLMHDWPGWWAKLEALRPGAFPAGERVLLLDLDTLVVGDLSELGGYDGEFAMIRDVLRPAQLQSGVLAFRAGPDTEAARLYRLFAADPQAAMRRCRGDGEWLRAHARQPDALQDLFPGQIRSFKRDARQGPPEGARLVLGHGRPRFNDPRAGWAHRAWARLAAA